METGELLILILYRFASIMIFLITNKNTFKNQMKGCAVHKNVSVMCFSVNSFLSVAGCVFCKSQTPLYICEKDTVAVLSDIRSPDTCAVRTERQTE